MNINKKKYVTAHEIDGHKAIRSPHARELEEMGQQKADIFTKEKKRRVKILLEEELTGKIENLGFGEDYTLTFEFFPEVKIHVLYTNFEEDEEEPFEGAELKFLFSGERVRWIPTEDLIGLIEATFVLIETLLQDGADRYELPPEKSILLVQAIQQRQEPFVHLKSEHLDDLAAFVGGKIARSENSWALSKALFQGFNIILVYDIENKRLDVQYEGEKVLKINNYARDYLGIFLINHCLRFISITYPDIKMPKIVGQVFSYSYLKSIQ